MLGKLNVLRCKLHNCAVLAPCAKARGLGWPVSSSSHAGRFLLGRTGSGRWGRGFAGFLPNVVWCVPVLKIVGRSSSFRLNVSLGIMSYLNKKGELSCSSLLGGLLVGYLLLFSVVMRHYSRCLFVIFLIMLVYRCLLFGCRVRH